MTLEPDMGGGGSREAGHSETVGGPVEPEEGGEPGLPVEGLQPRREEGADVVLVLHVHPAGAHLGLEVVYAGGALAAGRVAGAVVAVILLQGLA